jgi:hypothetical protein
MLRDPATCVSLNSPVGQGGSLNSTGGQGECLPFYFFCRPLGWHGKQSLKKAEDIRAAFYYFSLNLMKNNKSQAIKNMTRVLLKIIYFIVLNY